MKKYLLFIIVNLLISSGYIYSQYWEQVTSMPRPYLTNYWLDVYFLPSNSQYGWICGFNGMVIRTTDGGATWQGTVIAGADHLESIHFPSVSIGYTSGPGGIFKSVDGGANWSNVSPTAATELWGCYFMDNNNGLVIGGGCGGNQNFWRTTNGGVSWALYQGSEPNSGLTDAIVSSTIGEGFASSSGRIWRTNDGGFTWNVFSNSGSNVWQEEITNINNAFLVPFAGTSCPGGGQAGGMRFSGNQGVSWLEYSTGEPMFGAFLISESIGWACGYNRAVYYTNNGGRNWELRNCGIRYGNLDDMWFINGSTGWVVGEGVYKLSPSTQKISKTSINFGDVCIPGQKDDSVWISNFSMTDVNASWLLTGPGLPEISVIGPRNNFSVPACDSILFIIRFRPTTLGVKNANFRVDIFSGPIFDVAITGNAQRTTVTISDTLIEFNPLRCGKTEEKTIKWQSQAPDEWLQAILQLSGSQDILLITPTPFKITSSGNETRFSAITRDTGWISARFKASLSPCYLDTFITVRAYGVSPIIKTPQKSDVEVNCQLFAIDSVAVFNTGNDTLILSTAQIVDANSGFQIIGWTSGGSIPIKILPGSSDTVIISYTPKSPGIGSTRIRFENNDVTTARGDKNPLDVQLSATVLSSNTFIKDTTIDFREVCINDTAKINTIIYNRGNIQSYLDKPSTRYNVFSVIPLNGGYPTVIGKADSLFLTIRFQPKSLGNFSDTAVFITQPCNDTVIIIMKGRAINSALSVVPKTIQGLVQTNIIENRKVTVKNTGTSDLKITALNLIPAGTDWTFSFSPVLPVDLKSGDSVVFSLDFTALTDTTLVGNVCIKAEGKCPLDSCIDVNLRSYSKSIKAVPGFVDFGFTVCEKKVLLDTITVINEGFIPDTVNNIYFNPVVPAFRITNLPGFPVLLIPNDSFMLFIEFNPPTEGYFSSNLTIESNNLKGRDISIPLQGEYRKALSFTKDSVFDFGQLEPCDSIRSVKFMIINYGTLTDTIYVTKVNKEKGFFIYPDTIFAIPPLDSVEMTMRFNPGLYLTPGYCRETYIITSKICGRSQKINAIATIIRPILTINPKSLDFGQVWMDDSLEKNITVYNGTPHTRFVTGIFLLRNDNYFSVKSNLPKAIPGDSLENIKIKFTAKKTGKFSDTLVIFEESVCRDTTYIPLTAEVPEETYSNKVILGNYTVNPGERTTIAASLELPLPRVSASLINYTISFDKWLFMPSEILFFDGNSQKSLHYSYSNGVLSGAIEGDNAANFFRRAGDFLYIKGTALFSSPDYTPFVWEKFDAVTNKTTGIETQNGSLKISPVCHPVAELRYKLLPGLSLSATNQVITGDKILLNVQSTDDMSVNAKLTNLVGNILRTYTLRINKNTSVLELDVSDLSGGIYFITIFSPVQSFREKVNIIK